MQPNIPKMHGMYVYREKAQSGALLMASEGSCHMLMMQHLQKY